MLSSGKASPQNKGDGVWSGSRKGGEKEWVKLGTSRDLPQAPPSPSSCHQPWAPLTGAVPSCLKQPAPCCLSSVSGQHSSGISREGQKLSHPAGLDSHHRCPWPGLERVSRDIWRQLCSTISLETCSLGSWGWECQEGDSTAPGWGQSR